jgi:asparagine synthase (glutamine-hydrolysing)
VVYLDGHGVVEPEVFAAMCRSLAHRGPDDEGIHTFPGGALGMRRLSIIDLERGHQPMSSPDGEYWIVFNGEIYNYRELRHALERDGHAFRTHSDTEVVLRLYETLGARCLEQLRGMFAFAVWDQRRRSLFLARDRLGIKPLYVYRDPSRLIFASEIKAILADPTVERELDPIALDHYLSLLYVPAPRTMLRNIETVPPASYATLKDGAYDCREYWDVVPASSRSAGRSPSAASSRAGR